MYLSKILITGPPCRNSYEIHRSLWGLFPEDADKDRDFLFRVSQGDRNHAEILMQSTREPRYPSSTAQILACKEYSLAFVPGDRLRFLLIANPIKTIKDEASRKKEDSEIKKCRVPLIREDEQREWIERKFRDVALLETIVIDPILPLRFKKSKEDRVGKIQPVNFQGVLKVIDAAAMLELVKTGVGPAKAFGCGLVSLSRRI
jgi:CRISPR system Cascade subunit CasE